LYYFQIRIEGLFEEAALLGVEPLGRRTPGADIVARDFQAPVGLLRRMKS